MTLVGFKPETPGWLAKVLTPNHYTKNFNMFLSEQITVFESSTQNLPYAGTFLISEHPIVGSDRACLELLRPYGISKWPKLDSGQMCAVFHSVVFSVCTMYRF